MKQQRNPIASALVSLVLAAQSPAIAGAADTGSKQIVGATEVVEVAGLTFRARVDTGAETTSIHAEDVVAAPGAAEGKPVSLRLVNAAGETRRVNTIVAAEVTVRTSEGKERRYKVALPITWNGREKTVLVTLNDRRSMSYRLLLGRNWLRGDYLVDVDRNADD